jgi:alkanesulfonate monooxygenase SsuD/methylene tetrahydromethanopterin reductase-like flavin-dependent oxidoreductase (luciferase family)
VSLGVALAWHTLPFEALLDLVRLAERLGYRAAFVDGDVSMLPSRGDADVLDGFTVTTALLARTERIEIGSIRLVHHWNAARLAQCVATLERIFPGRVRFLVSIGGQAADRRFGLPVPAPAERIAWLDETLSALRALWRGESVTLAGRHVRLEGARVRPIPRGGRLPIEVAGARPRLLEVVARHADVWDVNLPPVAARVERATAALAAACRTQGRDPAAIARSMWLFTRLGRAGDPGHAEEFRRLNPWFRAIPDAELPEAIVAGSASECRARLEAIRRELRLEHPVLDLSGLDADSARRVMEALAPGGQKAGSVRPEPLDGTPR